MTNWAAFWYIAGTVIVAAIGWWCAASYLARVRDGQAGRRGVAPAPAQVPLQPRQGPGLTSGERLVLNHLAEAWNTWCRLQGDAQADIEMSGAIHRAQDLVALRVAQRVAPDVWAAGPKRGPLTGAEQFKAGARPGSNPPPPAGGKPSPPTGSPAPFATGPLTAHQARKALEKAVENARSKALAEDLVALANSGMLALDGILASSGISLPPAPPPATVTETPVNFGRWCDLHIGLPADADGAHSATPPPAAKPSLTARERHLLTLSASDRGDHNFRERLAEPITWQHWRGGRMVDRMSGTRLDWYAYLLADKYGPAPTAAATPPANPHLTTREHYLMTQAWNRARQSSEPRSLGEWLRETTEVPDRVHGGSWTGPLGDAMARRVARIFGAPGQTPEAR